MLSLLSLLLPFLWIAIATFVLYQVWSFVDDIRLGAIVFEDKN